MSGGPERVTLRISPQGNLRAVATLVAGGLAGRMDIPVDRIDDLQLALMTLSRRQPVDSELTAVFSREPGRLSVAVGPLAPETVEAVLPTVARLVTASAERRTENGTWLDLAIGISHAASNGSQ